MSVIKNLNRNKIGGIILILVIIIAFGFGGFGGGFLSNNQNNIAKINKNNITKQDLINYIRQSGISQKTIQDNLNNDVIEELLSTLISTKLLDLEIEDFDIKFTENSLSKKIKLNDNFVDENGIFQRIKYEKFLLENNIPATLFEKRLRDRELQKKLFNFIGAGTISPNFLVSKLYESENKKLKIDFIDLEIFYKKNDQTINQDLVKFVNENSDRLKVEYIDFKYSIINPQNLIGIKEYNQDFFDKIDEIENNILNGVSFDTIVSDLSLNKKIIKDYKYSNKSNSIEKKIYEVRSNKIDIFENNENFIIYKIENTSEKKPDLNDAETKNDILKLFVQKNKFDYSSKILEKIRNKSFTENSFLELGKDQIQSLTLNSVRDNKRFDIDSVKMLYTLPINTFTLIDDEKENIYLAKIVDYKDTKLDKSTDNMKSYIDKENMRLKNSILQSYDFFLNDKYNVNINQAAIGNIKNLFQ
jgi:peptidyl-prolyl cis-trans isomerase D